MSKAIGQRTLALVMPCCAMAVLFGAALSCSMKTGNAADPPSTTVAGIHATIPDFDASKVKGAESCRKCHESEYTAWTKSMHFSNHDRITSAAGKEYASKAGGTDACQACHSTPHDAGAQFTGTPGVSCESCHTPAGGADGWFEIHSGYVDGKDARASESEAQLKERLAKSEAAGMIRAANVHALASNCFSCHIVTDESVLKAGHKTGQSDFELIGWMQGEVRHNFQVDQTKNAEAPSLLMKRTGIDAAQRKRIVLVVGKMAELEACLRALSTASDLKARYAGSRGWAGRAEDAHEFLAEDIGEEVDNEHIKAAVAAVDFDLGRKFEDQAAAGKAADAIAKIAEDFSASAADIDLSALDKLVDKADKPKGDAYSP